MPVAGKLVWLCVAAKSLEVSSVCSEEAFCEGPETAASKDSSALMQGRKVKPLFPKAATPMPAVKAQQGASLSQEEHTGAHSGHQKSHSGGDAATHHLAGRLVTILLGGGLKDKKLVDRVTKNGLNARLKMLRATKLAQSEVNHAERAVNETALLLEPLLTFKHRAAKQAIATQACSSDEDCAAKQQDFAKQLCTAYKEAQSVCAEYSKAYDEKYAAYMQIASKNIDSQNRRKAAFKELEFIGCLLVNSKKKRADKDPMKLAAACQQADVTLASLELRLNSMTKKECYVERGFNEALAYAQDTQFISKLADCN